MMAVSCGTPTPATIRVVQIEPGPMPTLIASAPASMSALRRFAGRDVAGDHLDRVRELFTRSTALRDFGVVAVRRVDDDAVAARLDQRLGAREAGVADGRRRRDAKPALRVLGGVRAATAFSMSLTVIRPTQMIAVVDDEQLLDPPLVKDAPRDLLARAQRDDGKVLLRHQLADTAGS